MASGRLVGKVALVTGGASGIGQAVCRVFANEGAKVAAADLQTDGLASTVASNPDNISPFHCDVSNRESLQNALKEATTKFGSVPTVAVNCAGIVRDGFLLKMSDEQFDEVIRVNLKGSYLVTQLLGQALAAEKTPGSIVHLSSIIGKTGNIGQANYAASKAGVIGLTKTSAIELARYNIRVNAILPGFIETPMTAGVPENIIQMLMHLIPLRRTGSPEEVAKACLFLACDDSSYVTGTTLEVTGGFYA